MIIFVYILGCFVVGALLTKSVIDYGELTIKDLIMTLMAVMLSWIGLIIMSGVFLENYGNIVIWKKK